MNRIRLMLLVPFALAVSAPAIAEDGVVRLSEPVAVTDKHEFFGGTLDVPAEPMSLTDAVASSGELAGKEIVIETTIAQVCQKKGCFFIAKEGDAVARVSFKDYGFFIPTDASNKTVALAGQIERREVSAEQAAHYAADLGDDGAVQPGFEYAIVASAVRIPKD